MKTNEDHDRIIEQLGEWSLVEPRPASEGAIDTGSLRLRISHKRALLQRAAFGLLSICGVAALIVYHQLPASFNDVAPLTVGPLANTQTDDRSSANVDDLGTRLRVQIAAAEAQIGHLESQLANQLEKIQADVQAFQRQDEPVDIVDRYYAARRQRVREQVLDEWLARNP